MTDTDAFVERFAAAWADPTPDRLCAITVPDVRLFQPLAPTIVGHGAFREQLRHLFELIPDLHGEVTGHTAAGDLVHIDMTLRGTLGGRPVEWDLVDVIELQDGLVRRRVSYFDPLVLLRAIATRPSAWRPAMRTLVPLLRRG